MVSKRQRRRTAKRRNVHVEQVKRRGVLDARLPIALAAVAAPAVAAPAALAAAGHQGAAPASRAAEHHVAGASFTRLNAGRRARTLPGSFAGVAGTRALQTAPAYAPTRPAPAPAPAVAPTPTPAPAAPTPAPADSGTGAAPAPVTPAPAPAPSPETSAPAPAAPAVPPTPADAGGSIAPTPAPAPVASASPADTGAAIAPAPAPTTPAPAPADAGQSAPAASTPAAQPNPQAINPDAPPVAPNPTPNTGGTGGLSVGASYYDGIGGGATLVATPQGLYIVPEVGIGFGPSVSANVGSNVNVPNAPQLQLGFTGGDQIGPVGYRGSGTVTVPLNDPSPNNVNVGANVGINAPGTSSLANIPGTSIPLTNVRVSGNYSPAAGATGGVQLSGTNQLFDVSDQVKLAVRVPIPLPNLTTMTPADANGVSDVITPTGPEGPPAMSATRNVSNLGYPDGKGDTVTLNPDGSYTVDTTTSDVTTYGPNYSSQQGVDPGQGGTLTHQLIDTMGQRTDQWTWQGNDGQTVTQTPSGTLTQTNTDGTVVQQSSNGVVTQTNPDGSTITYDPSNGSVTTSDGHWFGTTTTFNQDGSVTQTNPGGTTMWDSSGNGQTIVNTPDGPGFPVQTPEAAPTAPTAPGSISLPHDPNAPAPTSSNQPTDQQNTPAFTDQQNTPAVPSDTAAAPTDTAAAPTDTSTPAPTDTAPPIDTTPVPAPVDTAPPIDTTPAPAPVDTAPPVDIAPPIDTTRYPSTSHHPSTPPRHPSTRHRPPSIRPRSTRVGRWTADRLIRAA